jgi:hypothetical protein
MSENRINVPEAIPPSDAPGLKNWLRRLCQAVARLSQENASLRERVVELEKKTQEEN